jgi:hypothetical protein
VRQKAGAPVLFGVLVARQLRIALEAELDDRIRDGVVEATVQRPECRGRKRRNAIER